MLILERPRLNTMNVTRANESHQKNQIKREIAGRIRARREYLKRRFGGWSIEEVAESLSRARGVPLSRMGYNKYETGENEIAVSDLGFLADVLGVTANYLLGQETEEEAGDDEFIAWYRAQPDYEKMTHRAIMEVRKRYHEDDADESVYGKTRGKKAE